MYIFLLPSQALWQLISQKRNEAIWHMFLQPSLANIENMLLLYLFTFLRFYLNILCNYSISPNSLEILKTKGGWKTSTEKAEAAYGF